MFQELLNAMQIASLIKKENGFLESAEYRNDYLNNNYRGSEITRKSASGDFVSSFGSNLSYNEQETDMDGLFKTSFLHTQVKQEQHQRLYTTWYNHFSSINATTLMEQKYIQKKVLNSLYIRFRNYVMEQKYIQKMIFHC